MLPNKNLFFVTSAIKALNTRFYNHVQRFEQTVATLDSIRQKVPDAIIVLADASVFHLRREEMEILLGKSNYFMDMNQVPQVHDYSSKDMKSWAEGALSFNALGVLKQQPFMADVKRIFKISGRSLLEDGFDLSAYDGLFGKYVFKKRIPTWMPQPIHGATHLLITRMFSFCPSLIENYMQVCAKGELLYQYMDFEHATFVNIPKEHLVEFDKIHVFGWLAGNGTIENY